MKKTFLSSQKFPVATLMGVATRFIASDLSPVLPTSYHPPTGQARGPPPSPHHLLPLCNPPHRRSPNITSKRDRGWWTGGVGALSTPWSYYMLPHVTAKKRTVTR